MIRTRKANHMLDSIKARMGRDDEQGFTLIELMVVVLIIAILLAIAIPTFLSARNSANARGAQADLRTGLTAEQTYWTDNQAFDATTTDMQKVEPNINWSNTAPSSTSGANTVAIYLGTSTAAGDTVYLESYGKDGNCYVVQQVNDPAWTNTATGFGVEAGACTAPAAALAPVAPTVGQKATTPANVGAKATFPTKFYDSW